MLFHIGTFAMMVTFSILYGSDVGWRAVVGFWVAFIAVTFVVGGVLHAPWIALLLKIGIALAMFVKGQKGSSSFG
jgi:hypothetical protein